MAATPRLARLTGLTRAARGAAIGVAVALVLCLLRGTTLVESLELQLIDMRTRHFAPERTPDPRIVVVQVREADIDAMRRKLGVPWPWPLEYNAYLVRTIHEAGAAALMVDILHLDRGAGPDDVPDAEGLPEPAIQQREIEAAGADEYGAALKEFGKAAVGFELSSHPRYEIPARVTPARTRLGGHALEDAPDVLVRPGAELPVRRVAEGAALLGFVNATEDPDGVIRRAAVFGRWGERTVLSLPLATAQLVTGKVTPGTRLDRASVLRVGEAAQSLMPGGSFLVDFQAAGPGGGYAQLAAVQILEWALQKEAEGALPQAARTALEGKVVVLGVNAAGLKDVITGPLAGTMDGPVYQATVLDNLLHGDGRVRAPSSTNTWILFGLLFAAGILCSVLRGRLLPHLPPVALALLLLAVAFHLFQRRVSIDLFTPLLGLLLTWGGASAISLLTEGRRNRWLENTFGRYMAPSVIAALKEDPTLLELGGRERNITVSFSDIAGFTSISERLAPAQVVDLLNRYLTAHCAAVLDEEGVVDKFLGDAVMAFYSDPVPQEDHAARACRTALRVHRELPELAPVLATLGIETFGVRTGINSGRAIVGNMGSQQRFDYTCMGDTVNLASRFEGAAKVFGVRILIGPDTARGAAAEMLVKALGGIVVQGRAEPVSVYELLATRQEASADLVAHVEAFEAALAAARRGDLIEARRILAEADRLRPDDGPVAWFRKVLEELPRGATWDGVTVLRSK